MNDFELLAKKVSEPFLTVIPNGLVKNPNPHLLQNHTKRVRFGGVHFLISIQRLFSHENISTMNSESVN